MVVIIINFILAIALFAINGLLGNLQSIIQGSIFEYGAFCFDSEKTEQFSGNFFLKTINPPIFVAICCAVAQIFNSQDFCYFIWMTPLFFWVIRVTFILFRKCYDIVNWVSECLAFVVSLVLTMFTLKFIIWPLLESGESIFIPPAALRDALWYAIIAYIALTLWNISKLWMINSKLFPSTKIDRIVLRRYRILQARFGDCVLESVRKCFPKNNDKIGEFICLVYAIMIYEDFNRPFAIRQFERIQKKLVGDRTMMTLGVMQVATLTNISDEKSIEFATEKLSHTFLSHTDNPIQSAIEDYNNSKQYRIEVTAIHEILCRLISYDEMIDRHKVSI